MLTFCGAVGHEVRIRLSRSRNLRLTQFRMLMSDYEVTLVNDNSEYSDHYHQSVFY